MSQVKQLSGNISSNKEEGVLKEIVAKRMVTVQSYPRTVVVLVAFSSLARILEDCSAIHSPPAVFFVLFVKWRLARAH